VADTLWQGGKKATQIGSVVVGGLAANKAVNHATGRSKSIASYFNPLEYLRSAVQLPSSFLSVQALESKGSEWIGAEEKLDKMQPIFRNFMRPMIKAAVIPVIARLEQEGLVTVPEPSVLSSIADSVATPFRAIGRLVKAPFDMVTSPSTEADSWKLAEQKAADYGQNMVDGLAKAMDKVKEVSELPKNLVDSISHALYVPNYAIYTGAAAAALIFYCAGQKCYNDMAVSVRQNQTTNVSTNATGNAVHVHVHKDAKVALENAVDAAGTPKPKVAPTA
jgi:hypothetical protein